jgi:hypothetical protein
MTTVWIIAGILMIMLVAIIIEIYRGSVKKNSIAKFRAERKRLVIAMWKNSKAEKNIRRSVL